MATNYPRYDLLPCEAIADLQAQIRYAIQSDSDQSAMAMDALLAGKLPAYRATAVSLVYTYLHPYD